MSKAYKHEWYLANREKELSRHKQWRTRKMEARFKPIKEKYGKLLEEFHKPKELSEEVKLGIVAGLLIGEGCLSMRKGCGRNRDAFTINLKISNTDRQIIDFCQEVIGGHIGEQHPKGYKVYYTLVIQGGRSAIAETLTKLYPYMIAKREKAVLLMNYCVSRLGKPIKAPYSDEEVQIYEKLKTLNL